MVQVSRLNFSVIYQKLKASVCKHGRWTGGGGPAKANHRRPHHCAAS